MTIKLLLINKTTTPYIQEGLLLFINRLKHYTNFELIELELPKNASSLPVEKQKEAECALILRQLSGGDHLILLDETGKELNSKNFSIYLQKKMNAGYRTICFAVGGPYGFSDDLLKQSDGKLSLSKMTFTHEMVRLFFLEQLYRAFTILKGEKYHHG